MIRLLAWPAPPLTLSFHGMPGTGAGSSVAFAALERRTVLVHATAWNRLDISDPRDGGLLSARGPTDWTSAATPRPDHYLDYFHAGLTVSPDGRWLVDDGWVWHPVGLLRRLDLRRWLSENPWESEDGPSLQTLRMSENHWDGPRCFIDPRTVAVWGLGVGPDADVLLDAAMLYDIETAKRVRWFPGPPRGRFVFDRHLVVTASDGTTVWDTTTGEHLHDAPGFVPIAFHPSTRVHLSTASDGNDFVVSTLLE